MELDPDQLYTYKPTPKKSKSATEASSAVAEGGDASFSKKSAPSKAQKRKKTAIYPKRPASPQSAATAILFVTEEVEEEPSPERLKRKKRTKTKESEPALKAAEELFPEGNLSATPNPPEVLAEDLHLSVEDFLIEEHAHPALSESDNPSKPASPASASTQVTLGSACPAPIIIDDGK